MSTCVEVFEVYLLPLSTSVERGPGGEVGTELDCEEVLGERLFTVELPDRLHHQFQLLPREVLVDGQA